MSRGLRPIRSFILLFIHTKLHIGSYIADLVIDNKIIVELKSVSKLTPVMDAQLINYLKLSKLKVGYLMNFNSVRLEWKRFVNQGKGA